MGYKLPLQIKSRVGGPDRPRHLRINGPKGPREALLSFVPAAADPEGSPQERARLKAESGGLHGGSIPLRYSK